MLVKHTMYTWAASGGVTVPLARTEGIFLYEPSGNVLRLQLTVDECQHRTQSSKSIAAMKAQLDKQLLYTFPATATEPRARVGKKLAELVPGDINTFFFTLGGAEANENAIKAVVGTPDDSRF